MTKLALASLLIALMTAGLPAQGGDAPEKAKESKLVTVKKVVVSRDGNTDEKVVRRVVKNGKVIEASGDLGDLDLPGLEGLDLDKLVRDAVRGAGNGKTGSVSRRIVIKNGKTIVDEEIRDGDPISGLGDADKLLEDLKRKMPEIGDLDLPGLGGKPIIDVDVDVSSDGSGKTKKRTRRVVIRDGKKVEDHDEDEVEDEMMRERLRGIRESMGDLEGLLEQLEDKKRELERGHDGETKPAPGKKVRRVRRIVPMKKAEPKPRRTTESRRRGRDI